MYITGSGLEHFNILPWPGYELNTYDTQLPDKLFSPSDIYLCKKNVPPLFIAFFNWYGFL